MPRVPAVASPRGPRLRPTRAPILALALLLPAALSGCVMEEFVEEPYGWFPGASLGDTFQGPQVATKHAFVTHDRVDRVRVHVAASLETDALAEPLRGTSVMGVNVTLVLPDGDTRTYLLDTSRTFEDVLAGLVPGTIEVSVVARGQGAWSVSFEEYRPIHEDFAWFKPWRWS